jgi:hypothetical protein
MSEFFKATAEKNFMSVIGHPNNARDKLPACINWAYQIPKKVGDLINYPWHSLRALVCNHESR